MKSKIEYRMLVYPSRSMKWWINRHPAAARKIGWRRIRTEDEGQFSVETELPMSGPIHKPEQINRVDVGKDTVV